MRQPSFKVIYVKYAVFMCFIVALLSFVIYTLFTEPTTPIEEIIELFATIALSSMVIGAIIGLCVGLYIGRPLRNLDRTLSEIERGNFGAESEGYTFKEFKTIEASVRRLAKKSEDQALSIQKKTNEYVEKEQTLFEEAISIERGRLARELHDSVSQQLFAISMMSSAIYQTTSDDDVRKKQLERLEGMSLQAQSEMRALLLHLRPIQLEGKKLSEGIKELLTEISDKQDLSMKWHIAPLDLEKGVEDHLFRMLQEAISNTLRHAKASSLEVRLSQVDSFAMMRIMDDGVGFDTNDRKVGSYGLGSMQERAEEIGGTFKIVSVIGKGTQIEIKVPLLNA